jgi:putative MATE family efflux protein
MAQHSAAAESLGTDKIGKLLFQYSLPAIIAMTASSLYNVIDRIFIGHGVGPLAISGLALTLPLMNLAIAFGALVGAGAATLVSIRLGEQRRDEAARILGNTVLLNLILSSALAVVMLVFLDRILYLFGASRETLPYAKQFMQIILVGNVFMHSYMGLNNIMRASGYPRKAMIATLITVGLNVLLAPLFIFVCHWGIRGAALATVTVQVTGFAVTIRHFSRRDSYVRFLPRHFKLDFRIIRDILSMGMSVFIVNLCTCLITIVVNLKLVAYGGDFAVGAFGIINSILMCAVMIVLGLTQGMQPIAGYNYGARHFDRVRQVFHDAVIVATGITMLGFVAGEVFPRQIALAFTGNPRLVELSTYGMRIVLAVFPIVGFQIVTSNFFQAIGHPKISILLTLSRQVIFLLPALVLLPRSFGLTGVWAAIPVSDVAAFFLAFGIWRSQIRSLRARAGTSGGRPAKLVETGSLS